MRIVTISLIASAGLGLFLFAAERSVKQPRPAARAARLDSEKIAFEPVTVVGDAHADIDASRPPRGAR